jgi:hypothetical protein
VAGAGIDMKVPSARLVLFNAAAVLVALAAVGAVIRSYLVSSSAAPCSGRYLTSMSFPLERNGVTLTATDIQARGGSDASLADRLEVVRLEGGAVPVAMRVALPGGGSDSASARGIGFAWQPRSVRGQTAVCLSYQLQLPADFDFALGGVLPGVQGQADRTGDRFVVQPAWAHGGAITASSRMTTGGKTETQVADGDGSTIVRGRWVKVEQEVVLNAPGQGNGLLRVWLDGSLVAQRTDLAYRTTADVGIAGVAADVSYRGDAVIVRSAAEARVLLSPFEIRWQ